MTGKATTTRGLYSCWKDRKTGEVVEVYGRTQTDAFWRDTRQVLICSYGSREKRAQISIATLQQKYTEVSAVSH